MPDKRSQKGNRNYALTIAAQQIHRVCSTTFLRNALSPGCRLWATKRRRRIASRDSKMCENHPWLIGTCEHDLKHGGKGRRRRRRRRTRERIPTREGTIYPTGVHLHVSCRHVHARRTRSRIARDHQVMLITQAKSFAKQTDDNDDVRKRQQAGSRGSRCWNVGHGVAST